MKVNEDQHRWFEQGCNAAWLYARKCREKLPNVVETTIPAPPEVDLVAAGLVVGDGFDPIKFRKQMEEWSPKAFAHFKAEISTIGPDCSDRITQKGLAEARVVLFKHLKAQDSKWFFCSMASVQRFAAFDDRLPTGQTRSLVL